MTEQSKIDKRINLLSLYSRQLSEYYERKSDFKNNKLLKVFPISLYTLDNDNNNDEIIKTPGENIRDFRKRVSNTRSDKHFRCSNNCKIDYNFMTDETENQIKTTGNITGSIDVSGIVATDIFSNNEDSYMIKVNNSSMKLRRVILVKGNLFSWNQDVSIEESKRENYNHSAELHMFFENIHMTTTENSKAYLIIVIPIRRRTTMNNNHSINDIGYSSLIDSITNENPRAISLLSLFPENMGYFTYDFIGEKDYTTTKNTKVLLMENFVELHETTLTKIMESIDGEIPTIEYEERDKTIDNKPILGFLQVSRSRTDYNDGVYYSNETQIFYNDSIITTNQNEALRKKALLNVKLPSGWKIVKEDNNDDGKLLTATNVPLYLLGGIIPLLIYIFAFDIFKLEDFNTKLRIFLIIGSLLSVLYFTYYFALHQAYVRQDKKRDFTRSLFITFAVLTGVFLLSLTVFTVYERNL